MNTTTKVVLALIVGLVCLVVGLRKWSEPRLLGVSNGTGIHSVTALSRPDTFKPSFELTDLLGEARAIVGKDSISALLQQPTEQQIARWGPLRERIHQLSSERGIASLASRSRDAEKADDETLEVILALAEADAKASPQRATSIAHDLILLGTRGDGMSFPGALRGARMVDRGLKVASNAGVQLDPALLEHHYWTRGVDVLAMLQLAHVEQQELSEATRELVRCEFDFLGEGKYWTTMRDWEPRFGSVPGPLWLKTARSFHGEERSQAYYKLCQEHFRAESAAYICGVDLRLLQAVLSGWSKRESGELSAICGRHNLALTDPFQPKRNLRVEGGQLVSELWDGDPAVGQATQAVELSEQFLKDAKFSEWMSSKAGLPNYQLVLKIR